jgi:hypothetical protein
MRTALIATVLAVLGVPHRFPFANKVTCRFLLATADTDDGNHLILKLLRSRPKTHYLMEQDIKRRCAGRNGYLNPEIPGNYC